MFVLFFIGGLFFPAWPWAPLISLVTTCFEFAINPIHRAKIAMWWPRSKGMAILLTGGTFAFSVAVDTAAMFAGNWVGSFF